MPSAAVQPSDDGAGPRPASALAMPVLDPVTPRAVRDAVRRLVLLAERDAEAMTGEDRALYLDILWDWSRTAWLVNHREKLGAIPPPRFARAAPIPDDPL